MKTVLIALSLVVLCLAVMYGVPQYRLNREAARRSHFVAMDAANSSPLVLDAKAQAILDGADRVETFRLEDEDEDQDEPNIIASPAPPTQYLDHHKVWHVGDNENQAFAARLRTALSQVRLPIDTKGQCALFPSDFTPGVGFRVWKGEAHVDVCASFISGGLQVCTKDANHKMLQQTMTSLGLSRPAFLSLSKQAFPQDAQLARLN